MRLRLNPISGLTMVRRRTPARALVLAGTSPTVTIKMAALVVLVVVMGWPPAASGQQDERAVRAAYVYNLTKYVEWPEPGNEVVIGFVGDESMGEVLRSTLAGKSSDGRPIRVLVSPSDEDLGRCQILYIAEASPKKSRAAVARVRNRSILTVGDTDSFAREGGVIGLVRLGDQIQIQVNLEVAQACRLKISSRVLRLAALVHSAPGKRD